MLIKLSRSRDVPSLESSSISVVESWKKCLCRDREMLVTSPDAKNKKVVLGMP